MTKKYFVTLFCAATLVFSLVSLGCDTQGPAEEAGETIDNSIEDTQDAADNAADKITGEGPMENAGEEIDEAGNTIKETVQPND